MYTNKTGAKIVAHSKREKTGEELITYELTLPRIILAELGKYRQGSFCSSSSRAVPLNKMIDSVRETPFVPIAFQESHSGMQGTKYLKGEQSKNAEKLWIDSLNQAIGQVQELQKANVTKQLCNRILEPWMYIKVLFTANRKSFEHLFEQRCPLYGGKYKSWKEYCNDTFGKYKEVSVIERLELNEGKAEIHFSDLAEKMYDALNDSTPELLKGGEYHIPYKQYCIDLLSNEPEQTQNIQTVIKIAIAKCANVSYTTIKGQKERAVSDWLRIYQQLVDYDHMTPLELVCQCATEEDYNSHLITDGYTNNIVKGAFGPYRGFKSHRFNLEYKKLV